LALSSRSPTVVSQANMKLAATIKIKIFFILWIFSK
jgi:hypothetical protein